MNVDYKEVNYELYMMVARNKEVIKWNHFMYKQNKTPALIFAPEKVERSNIPLGFVVHDAGFTGFFLRK